MDRTNEGLKNLGKKTTYEQTYNPNVLERFSNKHVNHDYFVKFNCPEFTALCPITGQPDFATIYISYIPGSILNSHKRIRFFYVYTNNCTVSFFKKDLISLSGNRVKSI